MAPSARDYIDKYKRESKKGAKYPKINLQK